GHRGWVRRPPGQARRGRRADVSSGERGNKMKAPAKTEKAKEQHSLNNRLLLAVLRSFRRGEFEIRLPDDLSGVDGQICDTFNDLVQFAGALRSEIVELRQSVGREGRTHRRLSRGA